MHRYLFEKKKKEKVKFYSIFIYRFDSCLLITFITYSFLSLSYPPSLQTLNSHSEESKGKQSEFTKASNWNAFCQNDAFTITDCTLIRFLNFPVGLENEKSLRFIIWILGLLSLKRCSQNLLTLWLMQMEITTSDYTSCRRFFKDAHFMPT